MTIHRHRARFLAPLAGLLLLFGCDSSEPEATATQTTPISQMPAGKPAKAPPAARRTVPLGTGFDFYVLSLSWSPSYCEIEGEEANGQQCRSGRDYGFIVHGLWPQYERGWPENCEAEPPRVSADIVRSLRDIMPSGGLIGHQWRKHGACSGLSQEDYFTVVRAARERTVVPPAYRNPDRDVSIDPDVVEKAFVDANPGLPGNGIAVTCEEGRISEVRICLARDLSGFRACPEVDRRGCNASKADMPAPDG